MDRPLLPLTETAGQQSPVEVDIQLDQPTSRLPSLNGRFPASELPGAPPHPGHKPSFTWVAGRTFKRRPYPRNRPSDRRRVLRNRTAAMVFAHAEIMASNQSL